MFSLFDFFTANEFPRTRRNGIFLVAGIEQRCQSRTDKRTDQIGKRVVGEIKKQIIAFKADLKSGSNIVANGDFRILFKIRGNCGQASYNFV